MKKENTNANETAAENGESNRPDFVVRQYRQIRVEDGFRTRKEQIGVAWQSETGAITVRCSGIQIVEGDIYLFPTANEQAE